MQTFSGNLVCNPRNITHCTSGCVFESKEDAVFHGILKEIADKEFASKASLYDWPKLFEQNIPAMTSNYYNYPTHTLCQEDPMTSPHVQHHLNVGIASNCTQIWKDYISASQTNPYELDEVDDFYTCGKGLSNLAW